MQLAALSNAARSIFVHETAPSFASARDKRSAILNLLDDLAKVVLFFFIYPASSLLLLCLLCFLCLLNSVSS